MGIRWYHIAIFASCILGLALLSVPRGREYGVMLGRSGRPDEAQQHLRPLFEKNPDDRLVARELARTHLTRHRPLQAAEVLLEYLARHPDDVEVRWDAVSAMVQGHNLDEAIAVLEEMPRTPVARDHLRPLYEQTGRLSDAVSYVGSWMDGTREDADRWTTIARLQMWRSRPDLSIDALAEAARIDGSEVDWLQLLRAYEWRGELDQAVTAANRLREFPQLSLASWRAIRTLHLRRRDLPATLAAARQCAAHTTAMPQDWIDLAQLQEWDGESSAALATLRQGTVRFPGDPSLPTLGADLAYRLGDLHVAAQLQFTAAERSGNDTERLEAARLMREAGETETALAWLRPLAAENRLDGAGLVLLAGLEQEAGQGEAARALLAQAMDSETLSMSTLLDAADIYEQLGDTELMTTAVLRAEAVGPARIDEYVRLAGELGLVGRAEEGLARLLSSPVTGGDPAERARTEAWLRLAIYDTRAAGEQAPLGLRRAAIQAVETALGYGSDADLRNRLVDLYLADGRPGDARRVVASDALTPARQLAFAEAFLAAGERADAARMLANLPSVALATAEETSFRAYLHTQLGEHDEAVRWLIQADLQAGGADDAIRLALADAYGTLGNIAQQDALLDARAQALGSPEAWLDAADRRLWRGDRAAELDVLVAAREAFPGNLRVMARTLSALAANERHADAAALYEVLVQAGAAQEPEVTRDIAFAFLAQKDQARAAALFEQVLDKLPEDAPSLQALGYLRLEQGRLPEALGLLKRYVSAEKDPVDPEVLYTLGDIEIELGGDGRPWFRQVAAALPAPTTPNETRLLAMARWRIGQRRAALPVIEYAVRTALTELAPALDLIDLLLGADLSAEADGLLDVAARRWGSPWRLRRLRSLVRIRQQRYDESVALLQRLHAERPDDPDVVADWAYVEEARRRPRAAMDLFRKALSLREMRR